MNILSYKGGADNYYGRPRKPHYFKGNTYGSEMVTEQDMLEGEIEAYNAGYDENEAASDKKDWG